jgi:hypothetical protein
LAAPSLSGWRRWPVTTGCGDGKTGGVEPPKGTSQSEFERQLADASAATTADFPATDGRTLQEIADTTRSGPQAALATAVFVPGGNRLAFGVIGPDNAFVYGRTAVYVARSPQAPARGPFPAPADSLITKPAYRSRTAASETDPIASVYAAQVPLKRPGRYSILVVTKTGTDLLGAATEVEVRRDSPIPAVGERPPAAKTDTIASAKGDLESIDTRVPPARRLHEQSFDEVLGKRPVALLFATPQLCQSRVCGPVVDIAAQLQAQYRERMTFIHQEVYVDNQVDKGLRPSLRTFHLQTEPWLFTIGADGRVVARLEGSFGVRAFEQAVQAALR